MNLEPKKSKIQKQFKDNVESVFELMAFDKQILDFSVLQLEVLNKRLLEKFASYRLNVNNTIQALKNIQNNQSLQPKYEAMFNQCIVLLVSYFSSAIGDVFRFNFVDILRSSPDKSDALKEELKISLGEVKAINFELAGSLGELFIRKRGISFQDMQSICRAFEDYFSVEIKQDRDVNNIICAQACRHAIVHNGGIVDAKWLGQVKGAVLRDVKPNMIENEKIQFQPLEIEAASKSMFLYLASLEEKIIARLKADSAQ